MNEKAKKIMAIILLVVVAAGCYSLLQLYLPYREQQQKLAEQESKRIVMKYKDISYAGKSLGHIMLSNYNVREITAILKKEIALYEKSIATLQIDEDTNTYSMKELGQRIFYQCSNKKTFEAGEERKLADYLVSMDKDRPIQEQFDIINNDLDATYIDISIQCECREDKLTKFIQSLSKKYDKPAKDSRIDDSFKITPAKAGKVLDTKTIANELRTYLNRQTTKNFSGIYKTSDVEPTWYPKDLKKVNTIISRYSTTFTDGTPRGYNIHLAAKRLNGSCLLPGEKISFLDTLYDKSDKKSYKKSAAYFKGKVVQAEGGGICQVSTTAYHTFLLAGMIPKKRYPHSMPVGYAKMGLDAALSVGGKDLVIENKWNVPLLILAEAKSGTLAVAIQSYKNALDGYQYKPRAIQESALQASAYLDVYKGKKKIKTIPLGTDVYKKKKN